MPQLLACFNELKHQVEKPITICTAQGLKIATAESCTGGLISAAFTEISGSSAVFECGFVTYSNESKNKMLGVPMELIEKHGAVSEEVACAMAVGAREKAAVDLAVSVTGIAGPSGGSAAKPVGLVYIAVASKNGVNMQQNMFTGDRAEIRKQAVSTAIAMLTDELQKISK
jgi:nicotinamide-nucleotide amidase